MSWYFFLFSLPVHNVSKRECRRGEGKGEKGEKGTYYMGGLSTSAGEVRGGGCHGKGVNLY